MSIQLKVPILLASQSPRRQELLKNMGLDFEVQVREVDEIIPDDLAPRAVAVLISENKAKRYNDLSNEYLVITADTIVALDEKILGKPKDYDEAVKMLKYLSGRQHTVITGVTLFHKGKFRSFSRETFVTFRRLNDSEINYYVEKYQPYDKAGAYGIQEWLGMVAVSRLEGDFYNVMGLPTAALYSELVQFEP